MSEASLIVHDGRKAALTAQAEGMKAAALERSALIAVVRDEASNAEATKAMRELSTVLKSVEAARKQVKEPVLDLCRRIDSAAKEFIAELEAEHKRLAQASCDYQTEQTEKLRAIERARAAEAERIERERAEEERRLREEQARREAEIRAKAEAEAAEARNAQEIRAAVQRAADATRDLAIQSEAAVKAVAERKDQELMALPPPPAPTKAEGQIVREVWLFEVTDVWTLARMHPGLVRIEVNRQEVNEVIARLAMAGEPKIAGLRIYRETKVSVRTGREKAIDV